MMHRDEMGVQWTPSQADTFTPQTKRRYSTSERVRRGASVESSKNGNKRNYTLSSFITFPPKNILDQI